MDRAHPADEAPWGVFADELRAGIAEAGRNMTEARLAGDDYGAEADREGCGTCGASPPPWRRDIPPGPRTPVTTCGDDAAAAGGPR
jgi:hypothetical protein